MGLVIGAQAPGYGPGGLGPGPPVVIWQAVSSLHVEGEWLAQLEPCPGETHVPSQRNDGLMEESRDDTKENTGTSRRASPGGDDHRIV